MLGFKEGSCLSTPLALAKIRKFENWNRYGMQSRLVSHRQSLQTNGWLLIIIRALTRVWSKGAVQQTDRDTLNDRARYPRHQGFDCRTKHFERSGIVELIAPARSTTPSSL